MLLALEGCDAMGKATQASALNIYLTKKGLSTRLVAFPRDDGPAGSLIRDMLSERYNLGAALPRVIQSLMLADRMAAVDILNNPGGVTICDRYTMSGVVYGLADGLEEPWLYNMHKCLPQADVQILLDGNPEIATKRRPVMRDRYEKDFAKLHKIREIYKSIWENKAKAESGRWYVINAMQEPIVVLHDIVAAYEHSEVMRGV